MQPPPPINVQPSPPSPLSPYDWQWRRYVALLEMCFFLTLCIGFGALLYLLFMYLLFCGEMAADIGGEEKECI